MLENYKSENILFLDIETAPAFSDFSELPDNFKKLWKKKAETLKLLSEDQTVADKNIFYKSSIYAEFGKIICISVGLLNKKNEVKHLRLKSYYGDDEKIILSAFAEMINKLCAGKSDIYLCAHNGKEFDYPYISRRMIINGLTIPKILDLGGKKPWEVNHLDTLELWKFGDYKSYTSLNLLTAVLNIPTPKDDIDGSEVARVYWEEKNIERIATYCQKDVLAVAQIFMRFKGEPLIIADNIEFV